MQENNWLTEPQQQQNNVSLTTNTPPEEPYDMIQALFDLPDFNWADYPLSPVNVNNVNDDDDKIDPAEIIDLTTSTDDKNLIDIDKYVFDSWELWNPAVKKIKKNKKVLKKKK